jgi:glycosyltransferase involved in cell wall biosynthesis
MTDEAREAADPDRDELLSELYVVRSLSQRLRVDLERHRNPLYTLRHLPRSLARPVWQRARALAVRVVRATLRRRRGDYSRDFRPYKVRSVPHSGSARPRVLHAIGNFRTGGSARLVVDLVEGLGAEYEQHVLVREDPPVKGYEGLPIDIRPHIASSRPLVRLFDRLRPELIHVHYLADYRLTWSDDDYRWYIHVFDAAEQAGIKVIENVNIPTEPFRSDSVATYVYVSDYVRRRFARPGDTATVVYPGSDLDHFRPPADAERPDKTLGLVYRLERDKLNEASFDPIAEALKRRDDARAVVVGGGPLLPVFEGVAEQAGISDRVTFTGYVAYDELPHWYGQISTFVAPVHNESFGHVSVLAMGMGVPVAGYDVGALGEILGDSELLAPAGDTDALTEILVGLLDDPVRARELGASCRRRAEEHFSTEQMVARYRTIYGEVRG